MLHVAKSSLEKDPENIQSLLSLGTIGVLRGDQYSMDNTKHRLARLRTDPSIDQSIGRMLTEIGHSQNQAANDISRAGIMLDPSSARAWGKISRGGDASAHMALKLAQRDNTMNTDELTSCYEKSGNLGDVQSGVLLCPWQIEGWHKLKGFS
jgi:hypothetical protein